MGEEREEGEAAEEAVIMECPLSYSLTDEKGEEIQSGEAKGQLKKENLSIHPKRGKLIFLTFRDITEFTEGEYRIYLDLTSREKLTLFNLGYKYEDFLRELSRLRNEVLLKDLLMHEKVKKPGVQAQLLYTDQSGKQKLKGKCELRLYETAMVIVPERGELVRIPYSEIEEFNDKDYKLEVNTDFGEKAVFSMMGRQLDPTAKTLSDTINSLSLKVQSSLKELLPKADPSTIRKAARFMKEGKVAKRTDIESVSPQLWTELEKKLDTAGIKEEYDFLKSLAQKEKMCIGLKRGLLGDLTGEYIWFLIPIYSTSSKEPGNAVAMEATTAEGGGKATYFFRIVSRKDYSSFKKIEDLHKEMDDLIQRMNRSMLAINFRREPIYLPDKKLEEPQYERYRFAIQKIPALRELRQLFIGRVIHSTPDQWRKDAMDLLKFNVSAKDEEAKWKKGGD
nr:hypothetical protein [Candidatus Njordarchaeota archaeon]